MGFTSHKHYCALLPLWTCIYTLIQIPGNNLAGSKEEDASRILVLSGWWHLKGKALQTRADRERVFIAEQVKHYSFLYTSLTLNIRNDIDRVYLGGTDIHEERRRDWESYQELSTSIAHPPPSNRRFKERSIHQTSGQREDSRTPSFAFFLHKHSIGTDILLCDDEYQWKHYFSLKDQWRHRSRVNPWHWTDEFCSHYLATLKEWKVKLFGNICRISIRQKWAGMRKQELDNTWKMVE